MQHIIKKLRENSDYQGFFLKTLHDFNKKFGTVGLADMSSDQKNQFFNYIENNFKAKVESLKEGKVVEGTVELTFTANTTLSDMEAIKDHIAYYLDNYLSREKKYTFKVARTIGGSPAIKLK